MTPVIPVVADVLADPDALVPPAFWNCPDYVDTIGPEVADLGILFGYGPNPEQRLCLDGTFGMNQYGALTAFEVAVFASRQNLKTGFMVLKALGKALLLQRRMQIWTAHKESATDQAFQEFVDMIERSAEFSKRVRSVQAGKGSKAITFTNGCTIVFRPRTGKAGQSMSADDVDLDEYFAVEPQHEGSLIPTMSTRVNAQVGMASSAPHAASKMQRIVMRRGRAASLGLTVEPRLLYAEWSPITRTGTKLDGTPKYGPPECDVADCRHALGTAGCIADRREVIKLGNPSAGRSKAPAISWEFIEDERRKLQGEAIDEYFKERLSIGVEDADADAVNIFGPVAVWDAAAIAKVADGVSAVGVALSPDRTSIALTGAALIEVEDPDDDEAEPDQILLVAPIMHTHDIDAAIDLLKELQDDTDCLVPLDEKGPVGTLMTRLEDADIAVEPYDLAAYGKACAMVYDRVTARGHDGAPEPTLLHTTNQTLDEHVAASSWRYVGDIRVIARRDGAESIDITLIEAGVLAAAEAERAGAAYELTDPPGGTT